MVRLQKFLADAGVASRRAGEQIILSGRVSVNGEVVQKLGTKLDPAHDTVAVDGQPVRAKKKLYVALHKPQGYLCTRRDLDERRTIGELLPAEWGNLYSVGRLDYQSEGLLFLTNDGSFCLKLTHPRYGVRKTYLATIEGRFEPSVLKGFREGVKVDGELLRAESTRVVSSGPSCSVVEVVLTEGKNREVRRLFEAANLTVSRLQRVRIGPVRLGELKPGRWRTLTESEIESLIAGL